jgi:hypothetical protein
MQGMVDDLRLGYKHPTSVTYMLGSNLITINAHGLRDEEIPYTKADGEKRVLVLGDSVTFGWGVSQGENFTDRMESILREQTGEQWQVINAGVNGYNTEQEATFLRIEGMRYSPDYVLLIYVSNDVDPVLDPNETTWRRYPTWPPSLPEAMSRLRQLSYLFQLAHLFARMNSMDLARAAVSDPESLSTPKLHSITGHRNWPRSKAALLDIARQCKAAGIPFLVASYSSLKSGVGAAFMAEMQEAGIDSVNLQPSWGGVPGNVAHVSRIDSHPSALVHEKMAEYLVNMFRNRGWLGDS